MAYTEQKLAEDAERTAEELIDRGERMLALGRELLGMSAKLAEAPSNIPLTGEEVRALGPEKRSVGRYGAVTEAVALNKAIELGEFDSAQFADALGLDRAGGMKWLGQLVALDGALVRDGTKFRCLLKPPLKIWVVRQAGSVFTADEALEGSDIESGEQLLQELGRLEEEGVIEAHTEDGEDTLYEYLPPEGGSPREHPSRTPPEKLPPSYDLAPVRGEPVRIRRARDQRRQGSTPGARLKIVNNERNWERLQAAKEERAAASRAKQQKEAQQGGSKRRKK